MKLYYFQVAPNPTKVRVYLNEKGISVDCELINLVKGEQRTPEHSARDPLQKLPVLELDDGSCLTESLPIIEYFEELHPDPPMIGTTPAERAHSRNRERIADLGVLLNIARYIHATNSPVGYPPNPAVAEQAVAAMKAPLRVLETGLADHEFLMGDRPTIVDCTVYAAFNFARFGKLEIDPEVKGLHDWFARFSERDSVTALGAR